MGFYFNGIKQKAYLGGKALGGAYLNSNKVYDNSLLSETEYIFNFNLSRSDASDYYSAAGDQQRSPFFLIAVVNTLNETVNLTNTSNHIFLYMGGDKKSEVINAINSDVNLGVTAIDGENYNIILKVKHLPKFKGKYFVVGKIVDYFRQGENFIISIGGNFRFPNVIW
jgi:hypothetical protein